MFSPKHQNCDDTNTDRNRLKMNYDVSIVSENGDLDDFASVRADLTGNLESLLQFQTSVHQTGGTDSLRPLQECVANVVRQH